MAGEVPGAWLHLTGDPWITPDDILSDPVSSLTVDGKGLRSEQPAESDALSPHSPHQTSSSQNSDADSDTLPSPLLRFRAQREGTKVKNGRANAVRGRRSYDFPPTPLPISYRRVAERRCVGSQSTSTRTSIETQTFRGIALTSQKHKGDERAHQASKTRTQNTAKTTAVAGRNAKEPSTLDSGESTPLGIGGFKGCASFPLQQQKSEVSSSEYPLTPIELDLGTLAIIAALPDPVTGTPSIKLKSGSVVALLTPEQTCWQRATYIPGSIRLETAFAPPSASAMTDVDPLTFGRSRRETDDTVLDNIVDFFISFGFQDLEPLAWSPMTPRPSLPAPSVSSAFQRASVAGQKGSFVSNNSLSGHPGHRTMPFDSSAECVYESECHRVEQSKHLPFLERRPNSTPLPLGQAEFRMSKAMGPRPLLRARGQVREFSLWGYRNQR